MKATQGEGGVSIRPMTSADLPTAQAVVNEAFVTFIAEMTGVRPEPLFHRHFPSRFAKEPQGCFVAETDAVVGVVLSVTWGSLGWFGPIAVLPSAQGRKVAQRLLDALFDHWAGLDLAVQGLETFPQSPLHLALYERYGFRPRFLTPQLIKKIGVGEASSSGVEPLSLLDGNAQSLALKECRELGEMFLPNLDFTKEIRVTAKLNVGETFLLDGGRDGLAICHTRPGGEGVPERFGFVHLLAVRPGPRAEAGFLHLLGACEAYAALEGSPELRVEVNTAYWRAYELLRARGYQMATPLVRMTRGRSPDEAPDHFLVDNWR